jgi:sorbitol/mannitol transport system permease protein
MSAPSNPDATLSGSEAESTRKVGPLLVMPSVIVLLAWMIVPLVMTLWFSFQYYNLVDPTTRGFAGIDNYAVSGHRSRLLGVAGKHPYLLVAVLAITVGLGTLLAVVFNQPFPGRTLPACWRSRRSSSCPRSAR